MDSYMETQFHHHHHHHHHNQHQQHNSGLLRFRSAPTSLFNELTQSPIPSGDELLDSSYETKPHRQSLNNSQNRYSGSGQLPPQYPKQQMGSPNSGSIQRSNSLEIERHGGLNLNRQSSSPAGLFSHLMNPQNGYTIMRGLGNFRVGSGTDGESNQHLSRLSMSHLPQIPEIANENSKETTLDEDVIKFRSQKDEARFESLARFPFASLNDTGADSSHLSENVGLASRPNLLVNHLSLPKTSAEMAAVEKLFHFQDTVPFKVRAKRGCATHPRSIAERVRRNRIAERMRKLQELVPNMDKQTNTADMLDLAVEYIKCLQNQQKVLRDNRAKCKCVYSETFTGKLKQAT